MRFLTTLFALLSGRLSGYRWFTLRGEHYLIARPIAGSAPEDDPPEEPEPTDEPEGDPTPEPEPEPEEDDEPAEPEGDLPKFEGDFDADRARRAIAAERAKREKQVKAARKRTEEAEAKAQELAQAQETEQERLQRERDESRAEAQAARERADQLLIDTRLREAAQEAGIVPKRVLRAIGEIDRSEITVEDGEVEGASEAIDALVASFDADDREYYLGEKPESAESEEDQVKDEPKGGNPDRKRKPKPMTPEQAAKLAREDPQKFNEEWEAGRIPSSALGAG